MTVLSQRLCWSEESLPSSSHSPVKLFGKKERKCEKTESNVQEPEIPEGKRIIGQDVVLFCN